MFTYFFDSSAIVKRYVNETGTAWVIDVTRSAVGNRIYVARITAVEVVSAIARQARAGDIFATDASNATTQFRYHLTNQYRIVEITPVLVTRAMGLAETYALRGYDAVQLAAALEVQAQRTAMGLTALTMVSADHALNSAASAEGLPVIDPNTQP